MENASEEHLLPSSRRTSELNSNNGKLVSPARQAVSPPSQSESRSISSTARGSRNSAPIFHSQQLHKGNGQQRYGEKGWNKEKIQLAPLSLPVAAVVQQLQNKPQPPNIPSLPFRLPPPGGALNVQYSRTSPSSSPERATRVEEPAPVAHLHFSWDNDFEQYLRNKIGQTGGFIEAMSQSPTSPDAVYEPTERSSVIWFRDNYPNPPPAHRRDVFSVQHWLEGQMLKLERSLQQQGLLHKLQGAQARHEQVKQPGSQPGQQSQQAQQEVQVSPSEQGQGEQGSQQGGQGHGESGLQPAHDGHGQQQGMFVRPVHAPPRYNSPPLQAAGGSNQGGGQAQHKASSPQGLGTFALSDDGRSSVQLTRDSEGFLCTEVLKHQERLFTRCMEELCGQAATLCVERGHLMWQLWAALRQMLRLVLQDRETSRSITLEARRSELSVKGSIEAEKAVTITEMEEVAHMNEVLNRRVLSRQAEIDQLRVKVNELEAHIASQANFNPALMQQMIDELQVNASIYERKVQNLHAKHEIVQRDFAEAQKEVQYLTNKLSEARSDYTGMASKLAVRTPRPSQPRMPPWDLIREEETILTQQALRDGCTPKDMHRLMLGVSFTNCNILPWINQFMGCCRNWTPAAKDRPQDGGLGGLTDALDHADAAETMSGTTHKPGTGGGTHSRMPSMAVNAHSRPGSILAGGSKGPGTRKSKFFNPVAVPIKDLHPPLSRLLSTQNVTRMLKNLSPEVVQAVSQMANHGIDPDSMACLLLGSVSPNGIELTSYKSLAGILSERFGGTAEDIGGPLTEALVMASMSTRERMEHLEKQLLLKHRMAVKYRRAIAEQRKQADDMKEHEIKLHSRKISRTPHPLTHLLSQKRAEFFAGLGMDPSIPTVLQHEGKVYCRNLEKVEAEKLVNQVWQSKREFENTYGVNVTLADYLYIFFHHKHTTPKALSEAAYNLLYNLSKHTYDPDCAIFLKVLMDEVGEDIRTAQDGLRLTLLEALKRIDQETNVKATGWLLKNNMRASLRKQFKDKSEHQVQELFDALDSDEPRELVNYYRLFDSDTDLNQGVFAETIRQQHLNEQMAFYQSIEDAILDHAEKNGTDVCTPQMLSLAFRKAHPNLSAEDVEQFQRRVFPNMGDKSGRSEKGKKEKASVSLDDALRLLRLPVVPHLVDLTTALELLRQGGSSNVAVPIKIENGVDDNDGDEDESTAFREGDES